MLGERAFLPPVWRAYTIAAIDGAGNASAQGPSASGTTAAPPTHTSSYAYDLADRLTGISSAAGGLSA